MPYKTKHGVFVCDFSLALRSFALRQNGLPPNETVIFEITDITSKLLKSLRQLSRLSVPQPPTLYSAHFFRCMGSLGPDWSVCVCVYFSDVTSYNGDRAWFEVCVLCVRTLFHIQLPYCLVSHHISWMACLSWKCCLHTCVCSAVLTFMIEVLA